MEDKSKVYFMITEMGGSYSWRLMIKEGRKVVLKETTPDNFSSFSDALDDLREKANTFKQMLMGGA